MNLKNGPTADRARRENQNFERGGAFPIVGEQPSAIYINYKLSKEILMVTTRYEVSNIVYVPAGRARQLRATFDLSVRGLGVIRACRYMVEGSHRWVVGPSMKDEYRGWFMVVRLEKEATAEILSAFSEAVCLEKQKQQTPEHDVASELF